VVRAPAQGTRCTVDVNLLDDDGPFALNHRQHEAEGDLDPAAICSRPRKRR
jgi:hypothetical protein